MKDAKSMYRGGDIVEACHCDFSSSRLLGLVCPFCNEAVYLRSGTTQKRNDKQVILNPCFSHYPGKSEELDCERRSISAEGRAIVERIKAEKRGQRLELYNKHLWDMLTTAENRRVPRSSHLSHFANIHPKSSLMPRLIQVVRQEIPILAKCFADECDRDRYESWLEIEAWVEGFPSKEREWQKEVACNLIVKGDLQLHKAIVSEIFDFLTKRTSGFVLEKIVKYFVLEFMWYAQHKNSSQKGIDDAILGFLDQSGDYWEISNKGYSFPHPKNLFGNLIIYTPWEAQIDLFSSRDRQPELISA